MKIEDIAYRRAGEHTLLGRLYQPDNAKALLVEVHGGAWTMNDRTTNAAIHQHLAANGYAVFALDFRMAPAHPFPAALDDIRHGVRFARQELKPPRIGGLGTSSGGYLITLCALRADEQTRLDFVIGCWPILDPLARYRMAQAKALKNLVDAHNAFFRDEAQMREANPQLLLERGEAARLPRMLVLQGTADENVEHLRADSFAERYRAAGGDIELEKFDGQPHTFIAKDPASAASRRALSRMVEFLENERSTATR
jgi:acetyl esterase/lipase